MEKPKTLLGVYSDMEVLDWDLAPQKFCVAGLIPKGLSILGGAPKIGKSWFVLDLCLRVSRGEPFPGQKTLQGETLYLCLEDTPDRLHYEVNWTEERKHITFTCSDGKKCRCNKLHDPKFLNPMIRRNGADGLKQNRQAQTSEPSLGLPLAQSWH